MALCWLSRTWGLRPVLPTYRRPSSFSTTYTYHRITDKHGALGVRLRRRTHDLSLSALGGLYPNVSTVDQYGALGGTRTHDLSLRRAALYPD